MNVDKPFVDNIQIVIGADYEAEFVETFDLTDLEVIAKIYDKDTTIAEFECEKLSNTEFTMKLPRAVTSTLNIADYDYSCHLVGPTISPAFLKGKVFVIKESDLS